MNTPIIVIVTVTLGVFCLIFGIKILLSSIFRKLQGEIRERFSEADIVRQSIGANFFGEQSKGGNQVRGNGALVLTKDQLFFLRAVPRKEYIIPISKIINITLPKSFNGKSIFRPLLCVHYDTGGNPDALAWAVKDPGEWKKTIESMISGR